MAKTKKKVVEIIKTPRVRKRKVQPKIKTKVESKAGPVILKGSESLGTVTTITEKEPEIRTVLGSNKAESLQKEGGWMLISAVKVGVDVGGLTIKEYKFRKE